VTADNTTNIAVVVTATNANGSATATSASVGPISSSSYAGYALAEVFTLPQYWVAGTQYTPITALPGYTFTRSGQQGAVDASGAVQFFAANVPAINSAGFHAYGALTNLQIQSQTFDTAGAWTATGTSVSANAIAAPDGTVTADALIENAANSAHYIINGGATYATGATTISVFAKQGSGTRLLQIYPSFSAGGNGGAKFDLTGGTVTTVAGTASCVGTITALANGWYLCTLTFTAAGAGNIFFGMADTVGLGLNGAYAGNGASSIYLWQAQCFQATLPNGGPIIATTTAAASIGANSFTNTVANGSYSAVYTFDDNSTQTIATTIAAGVFTFPTTLNRNVVKQVLMN
jgi:hypothetical protein